MSSTKPATAAVGAPISYRWYFLSCFLNYSTLIYFCIILWHICFSLLNFSFGFTLKQLWKSLAGVCHQRFLSARCFHGRRNMKWRWAQEVLKQFHPSSALEYQDCSPKSASFSFYCCLKKKKRQLMRHLEKNSKNKWQNAWGKSLQDISAE